MSKAGVTFFFVALTAVSDGEEPELGDVAGKDEDPEVAFESTTLGIKAIVADPTADGNAADPMVDDDTNDDDKICDDDVDDDDDDNDDDAWSTAELGRM